MSADEPRDIENEAEEQELRRASDRIERLLEELRRSSSPSTWGRVQELVSALTTMYGRAFARTLAIFADGKPIDERARAALCEDPLVESLLLLHGLHPAPVDERVARAAARVRRAAGSGGQIELSPIDPGGRLKIRITGDWRDSPIPRDGIEAALRRAIEEAAPDVAHLDIEGEASFSAPATDLFQIDLARSRRDSDRQALR